MGFMIFLLMSGHMRISGGVDAHGYFDAFVYNLACFS